MTIFILPLSVGLLLASAAPGADPASNELLRAATSRPWPGEAYPTLPSLSTEMRGLVCNQIDSSKRIRAAYEKLDAAKRRNVEWFEGVAELEQEKAVW